MAKSINHLRSNGSFVYKSSNSAHITLTETKGNPSEIPQTKIVDAFGVGKWPKIVGLLNESDPTIIIPALRSLCNMLKAPQDVVMCLKHDIVSHLVKFITNASENIIQKSENNRDADIVAIRELSSQALHYIALNANGKKKILDDNIPQRILMAFSDHSEIVRCNLYHAMLTVSSTIKGAQCLSISCYIPIILRQISKESSDQLRTLAVKLLKNCVNDSLDETVIKAVDMKAIEITSAYLYSNSLELQVAVCQAIGAMCFSSEGKVAAIKLGVVEKLSNLMMDHSESIELCAASIGALVGIAVNNDGKKAIVEHGCIVHYGLILKHPNYNIQLSLLKLIAVIAQYPPAKNILLKNGVNNEIGKIMDDEDELLARSARVALDILLRTP